MHLNWRQAPSFTGLRRILKLRAPVFLPFIRLYPRLIQSSRNSRSAPRRVFAMMTVKATCDGPAVTFNASIKGLPIYLDHYSHRIGQGRPRSPQTVCGRATRRRGLVVLGDK